MVEPVNYWWAMSIAPKDEPILILADRYDADYASGMYDDVPVALCKWNEHEKDWIVYPCPYDDSYVRPVNPKGWQALPDHLWST